MAAPAASEASPLVSVRCHEPRCRSETPGPRPTAVV